MLTQGKWEGTEGICVSWACARSWQFSTTHNTNAHPQRLPVWSGLCMNKDVFASLNSRQQLGSSCVGKELWEKQRPGHCCKNDSQQAFFTSELWGRYVKTTDSASIRVHGNPNKRLIMCKWTLTILYLFFFLSCLAKENNLRCGFFCHFLLHWLTESHFFPQSHNVNAIGVRLGRVLFFEF